LRQPTRAKKKDTSFATLGTTDGVEFGCEPGGMVAAAENQGNFRLNFLRKYPA